ncbi:hypothetical protein [Streptomyces sp. NPDC001889]
MSSDQQYPRYPQGQQPYQGPYDDPHQGPYPGPQHPHPHQSPHQSQYQGGQQGQQGQHGQHGQQGQYAPQAYSQPPVPQQDVAAQTWEGETWDTAYQPAIPPERFAPAPPPPPAAEETAYLPPVHGHGQSPAPAPGPFPGAARPLPAETPRRHEPAGPAPAPGAAGYSTPTTGGNTRVTDAQRARAEGRSPIIPPGIEPAALTAGLGLLLAGGAALGTYGLLVPLVLLQAVTAAGWFRLNGMWPARQGIALAFAGGLAADAVLLGVGRENAPAAILGTLGVWVLIVLVLQLRSAAGSDERMQGLMATVASTALTILAAGYLAAADDAVIVGGIAVAGATVARALPLPAIGSVVFSLLAGAGAGLAAGGMTSFGSDGWLPGLVAGALALVGLRVASYDYPSRFVHFTAGVALPLTAAAPAVYLLGRALLPGA